MQKMTHTTMRFSIFIILIFQSILMFGQTITDSERKKIETDVNKLVEVKKIEYSKSIIPDEELAIDTFIIEETQRSIFNRDYSTFGMVEAMNEAEVRYDILLNKYYKRLLDMLLVDDKEKLKEAQRSWIKFRDTELVLAGTMGKEEYDRGGTIEKIIFAGYKLELTKTRLFQIHRLLTQKT